MELFPNSDGGANSDPVKLKQDRPRKRTITKSVKAKSVSPEAVRIVWDYWVNTMSASKLAVLDDDRVLDIAAAIHDYGIDGCKQAINGCANSPWHMGNNPQHKKYNGISLILRNTEMIESFIQRVNRRDAREEFINE